MTFLILWLWSLIALWSYKHTAADKLACPQNIPCTFSPPITNMHTNELPSRFLSPYCNSTQFSRSSSKSLPLFFCKTFWGYSYASCLMKQPYDYEDSLCHASQDTFHIHQNVATLIESSPSISDLSGSHTFME